MELMFCDGGSWVDLKDHFEVSAVFILVMQCYVEQNKFGSYLDVYGCFWWDRSVVMIKCECVYIGNGRYFYFF